MNTFSGPAAYASACEIAATCRMTQRLMMREFPTPAGGPVDVMNESAHWSFGVFSQYDEDGLVLFVLHLLGQGGQVLLDIGAGHGLPSNSANLLVHHGWSGILVDAADGKLRAYEAFLRSRLETRWRTPRFVTAELTATNVVDTLAAVCTPERPDLMSIDVDGIDYWIADQVLRTYRPRVVMVEYQECWPADEAITVPPDWQRGRYDEHWYFGASLAAFHSLACRHGYLLAAVSASGFNALFVNSEEARGRIRAVTPAACLSVRSEKLTERRRHLRGLPWLNVTAPSEQPW